MAGISCPLAFSALTLIVGLAVYLMATVKVRARPAPAGPVAREIGELRQRMEELAARQLPGPAQAEPDDCAGGRAPLGGSINLSRRSQALRLHRRGETPEQIATALMVPVGEVRLLLKVHRLAVERTLAACPGLKPGAESADTFSSAGTAP